MKDLHIHSTFSDGENTPEEIVLSAIEKGIKTLGFSDHSYTSFDENYSIKKDKIDEYFRHITALKQKYCQKIEILCGIEQDYFSTTSTDKYDYVIGSVHYFKFKDKYYTVDGDPDVLVKVANEYYNGDIYSVIEEYYKMVSQVVERTNATIIGHIDLITKRNEDGKLFDINHPRYIKASRDAADKLLRYNIPFEVNTGAISRGYRTTPYPNADLRDYILENGGKFMLSSDSHRADTLAYKFKEFEYWLKEKR